MTVNVISATGQLGTRLVKELLRQGLAPSEVIASVHSPQKAEQLCPPGVRMRQAGCDNPETLQAAFRNTDVLALIPAIAPVEARIMQHFHALEAAGEAGVGRVVLRDFMAGQLESPFTVAPFSLYAESKPRQSGMAWTIPRNGMYADPLVPHVPELMKMGRIPYPAGDGRISYICSDDLARASAAACLRPEAAKRVYELTGPSALSVAEVAEIIARLTAQPVRAGNG